MANFLKLDLSDDDNLVVTPIQAETIQDAVDKLYQEALVDDNLEPCHGRLRGECLSKNDNSVQWAPGDGGQYTMIIVVPDTDEGRAEISSWID